jgi:hypothetical protein
MIKLLRKVYRIVSGISFVILVLTVTAYIVFERNVKTSGIIYNDLEKETGKEYFTGAVIMSAPLKEDEDFYGSPYLTFSQAQIVLEEGESGYLQYSVRREKKQYDLQINYLYDAEIIQIDVEKDRAKITAVKAGESAVQTLDNNNFKDIAYVKVIKRDE